MSLPEWTRRLGSNALGGGRVGLEAGLALDNLAGADLAADVDGVGNVVAVLTLAGAATTELGVVEGVDTLNASGAKLARDHASLEVGGAVVAVEVGAVKDGLDALVTELELSEASQGRDVATPAPVVLGVVLLLGDTRGLGAGRLAAVRVPVPLVAGRAADLASTSLGKTLALLAQVEVLGALLLLATLALVVTPVVGAAALALDPPELVVTARVLGALLDATALATETLEDVTRGARAALVVLLRQTAAGRAVPPPALGALGLTGRTETQVSF